MTLNNAISCALTFSFFIMFTFTSTAQIRLNLNDNYVLDSVYHTNNNAIALCTRAFPQDEEVSEFEVHFLFHDTAIYRFEMSNQYNLIDVLGTTNQTVILFEGRTNFRTVKISNGTAIHYKTIEPRQGVSKIMFEACEITPNGNILLVQKVQINSNQNVIGRESIFLNFNLSEISRSTHFWSIEETSELISIQPYPGGVGYLIASESWNGIREYHFETADMNGANRKEYLIGEIDSISPSKIIYDNDQWVISAFTYLPPPEQPLPEDAELIPHSEGIQLTLLDDNLSEISRNRHSFHDTKQLLVDILMEKSTVDGSINKFSTNGELDIFIEDIMITDSGYRIIAEAFSIGEGRTRTETLMDIFDPTECVLSIYDFVFIDFTKQGELKEIFLIEKPITNVLIGQPYETTFGINTAVELYRSGVFTYLKHKNKTISYIGYETLKSHVCELNVDQTSTVCEPYRNLRLPCSEEYGEFQETIENSRIARMFQSFEQKLDAAYLKFYERSEKMAHRITDINSSYPNLNPEMNNVHLALDNSILTYLYAEDCHAVSYWLEE